MNKLLSNYDNAKIEADKIDTKIINTLCSGKSFRVEAGAGSGKTYSLNKVIEWLQDNRWDDFKLKKQYVICITYTNAAVDVITSRLKPNSFITPSTIHSFAWESIKQYQSTLIKLIVENMLLPEDVKIEDIDAVTYTLGVKYVKNRVLHLFHNDVVVLFAHMLDNEKFRKIFAKLYPIILIDEYQDSFKSLTDKFLDYFIKKDEGPQFGFFGDSWQTIYQSNKACGLIEDNKIEEIPKTANFRSASRIVDFLNKLRPQLPQISAIDEYEGDIVVIHCNDFTGVRRSDRYFNDDLPVDELKTRLTSIESYLRKNIMGSEENLKILMITHKVLAAQQGYSKLYNLLGDKFNSEEDIMLSFFMNEFEPMFEALKYNNTQLLFEVLGTRRCPINTKSQKRKWNDLKNKLEQARNQTIFDVLEIVINSQLIPVPVVITEVYNAMLKNPDTPYQNGTVDDLKKISYSEIINGIEFLRPSSIYSTDHGVKGEEYDNIIFAIGRGWNNYNFEKFMAMTKHDINDSNRNSYERNRNLFYVCCSRPKRRLVLFITSPFEGKFLNYITQLVGEKHIFSYTQFISEKIN